MPTSSFWNSWQIFALGSALFAGMTAVLAKVGVIGINSNFATLIRTIVILLLLTGTVWMRGDWQPVHKLPAWSILFLVLSGIATGLSWLCYYRSLQLGPASLVAPVDKLSVVFAIILAIIFLGEKLTWNVALGAALVTAGAVVMIMAPVKPG